MTDVICVVLAAGGSGRMGFDKLAHRIDDVPIALRSLENLAPLPVIAVVSPALGEVIARDTCPSTIVVNAEPERGMAHSLRLAMPHVVSHAAFAVCLADVPLVTRHDVVALEHARVAGRCDVAFPVRRGQPGHPVIFGWRAFALVASLDDGDTLRQLRDDPRLRRRRVVDGREEPYLDVDTPDDLARYAARVSAAASRIRVVG